MNRPVLIPLGPDKWKLKEDFHYFGFTVPAGFVCDLDSVPRIPFVYARYKGRTVIAAIIHDYLYKYQLVSRKMADEFFLLAMKLEGVPKRPRRIMYCAVRNFGWIPWRRHQKRNESWQQTS